MGCAKTASGVVGFLLLATQLIICGEQKVPQEQFKTYPLRGDVRSADISPDDRFVAVNVVERSTSKPGEVFDTSRVELRDFKTNTTVASLTLSSGEPLRSPATKRVIGGLPSAVIIRYTPDGQSILAWFQSTLYVLQAIDLKVTQEVHLQAPPFAANDKINPYLAQLEVSPDSQQVVALWRVGPKHAVSTYKISSGHQDSSWPLPAGHVSDFVLDSDGQSAIFGIGDALCLPQPATNGVLKLNLLTGAAQSLATTGALPSRSAVLPGQRIAFTANKSCLQYQGKPDPELVVYSRASNAVVYREQTREATGWILAAPESNRMVAYSGDWKHVFDWGDFTGWYYTPARQTFTVWDTQPLQPIARSQNIPKLAGCTVRMSRSGRYIVTSGWGRNGAYAVYELP